MKGIPRNPFALPKTTDTLSNNGSANIYGSKLIQQQDEAFLKRETGQSLNDYMQSQAKSQNNQGILGKLFTDVLGTLSIPIEAVEGFIGGTGKLIRTGDNDPFASVWDYIKKGYSLGGGNTGFQMWEDIIGNTAMNKMSPWLKVLIGFGTDIGASILMPGFGTVKSIGKAIMSGSEEAETTAKLMDNIAQDGMDLVKNDPLASEAVQKLAETGNQLDKDLNPVLNRNNPLTMAAKNIARKVDHSTSRLFGFGKKLDYETRDAISNTVGTINKAERDKNVILGNINHLKKSLINRAMNDALTNDDFKFLKTIEKNVKDFNIKAPLTEEVSKFINGSKKYDELSAADKLNLNTITDKYVDMQTALEYEKNQPTIKNLIDLKNINGRANPDGSKSILFHTTDQNNPMVKEIQKRIELLTGESPKIRTLSSSNKTVTLNIKTTQMNKLDKFESYIKENDELPIGNALRKRFFTNNNYAKSLEDMVKISEEGIKTDSFLNEYITHNNKLIHFVNSKENKDLKILYKDFLSKKKSNIKEIQKITDLVQKASGVEYRDLLEAQKNNDKSIYQMFSGKNINKVDYDINNEALSSQIEKIINNSDIYKKGMTDFTKTSEKKFLDSGTAEKEIENLTQQIQDYQKEIKTLDDLLQEKPFAGEFEEVFTPYKTPKLQKQRYKWVKRTVRAPITQAQIDKKVINQLKVVMKFSINPKSVEKLEKLTKYQSNNFAHILFEKELQDRLFTLPTYDTAVSNSEIGNLLQKNYQLAVNSGMREMGARGLNMDSLLDAQYMTHTLSTNGQNFIKAKNTSEYVAKTMAGGVKNSVITGDRNIYGSVIDKEISLFSNETVNGLAESGYDFNLIDNASKVVKMRTDQFKVSNMLVNAFKTSDIIALTHDSKEFEYLNKVANDEKALMPKSLINKRIINGAWLNKWLDDAQRVMLPKDIENAKESLGAYFKTHNGKGELLPNTITNTNRAFAIDRHLYDIINQSYTIDKTYSWLGKMYNNIMSKWKILSVMTPGFYLRIMTGNFSNFHLTHPFVNPVDWMKEFSQATRHLKKVNEIMKSPKIVNSINEMISKHMLDNDIHHFSDIVRGSLSEKELKSWNYVMEGYERNLINFGTNTSQLGELNNIMDASIANKIRSNEKLNAFPQLIQKIQNIAHTGVSYIDDGSKLAAYNLFKNNPKYLQKVCGGDLYQKWSKQGATTEFMAERAAKYAAFDYSALTTFEKDTLRRFIPFYNYASKNAGLQIKNLLSNAGYPNLLKDILGAPYNLQTEQNETLSNIENHYIPILMGEKMVLIKIDLPQNQINDLFNPQVLGRLNPIIGSAYTAFTGKDLSTGYISNISNQFMPTLIRNGINTFLYEFNINNSHFNKLVGANPKSWLNSNSIFSVEDGKANFQKNLQEYLYNEYRLLNTQQRFNYEKLNYLLKDLLSAPRKVKKVRNI